MECGASGAGDKRKRNAMIEQGNRGMKGKTLILCLVGPSKYSRGKGESSRFSATC